MRMLLCLFLILFLPGCEDEVTLDTACKSITPLCEKIEADSNCRSLRESVMVTAYHLQEADRLKSAGINKLRYEQLINMEKFVKCSYLQTLIEFVPPETRFENADRKPDGSLTEEAQIRLRRYKESIQKRERQKKENYLYARRYQASLNKITKGSNSPYLQYYHWSRNQDKEALAGLRMHYDSGNITQYDMLYFLSQSYSVYEPDVAENMLLASLSVYPPELYESKNPPSDKKKYVPTLDDGDRLHYPVMRNLTHHYYSVKNYAMSYLFSKLLHLNNDRSSNITMIREELTKHVDVDDIDAVAETLHEALKDGEFSTKLIPLRLKNGKI